MADARGARAPSVRDRRRQYFGTAIHNRFEKIQEQLSDISAIAQESLAGVRVVRAYGQEAFEIDRFRGQFQIRAAQSSPDSSSGILFSEHGAADGHRCAPRALAGQTGRGRTDDAEELVAFNAYLTMLGWPMIAFGWVSNLLQRGMASWKRLLEVLDVEPLVSDANANDAVQSIDGEVEFRNLTFSFGDAVVLRGVSFKRQRDDHGHRRCDWFGQVDITQPATAVA